MSATHTLGFLKCPRLGVVRAVVIWIQYKVSLQKIEQVMGSVEDSSFDRLSAWQALCIFTPDGMHKAMNCPLRQVQKLGWRAISRGVQRVLPLFFSWQAPASQRRRGMLLMVQEAHSMLVVLH
mgnify:CR=1 FL=1